MSRIEVRFFGRDRYWSIALAVLLVAVVSASPWLVDRAGSWATSLESQAREAAAASAAGAVSAADSDSLLVLVSDERRVTRAVALLTVPEGQPGVLALIPAQLFDLLPGFGEFSLAQATEFEDGGLSAIVVQNVFGIRVDEVLHLEPGELSSAIGTDIEVALTSQVVVVADDGTSQLIGESGPRTYPAATVEALLVERAADDPLAWLERQASVWEAVIGAASAKPGIADALGRHAADPATASAVIAAVAASSPQVTLFPVERSAGAGDTDGFTADAAAVAAFVDGRLGHLRLGDEPRPRVEVLNGNGRIQATRPIVEVLVRNGFRIVRTDNADRFDFPATLVIAQRDDARPAAERIVALLGVGSLQLEGTSPSGVVDVSIIVGLDVPSGEG